MTLTHLFEPIQIKSLTLRNRVIMGSMHVGLEGLKNGREALIKFYQKRAEEGGPGLIVTGGISVSLEGEGGTNFLGFYRERDCEMMKSVTDAVHEVGGKIAAQLFHAGRYAFPQITGEPSVAPSVIRSPISEYTPKELTTEQIHTIIRQFGEGAAKAKELGFDAIEIMGSEGYLLNQFLSPITNQRSDEWGGDFERRKRFSIEVYKAVRDAVGENYPIMFRMSGTDLMPGSTTEEETIQFAKELEKAGVDILNIGIGWHESKVPTISTMVPRAGFIHITKMIKKAVHDVLVVGSNRINDPRLAEEILAKGECNLISMARPFLADPHLLQKANKGQFNRINTCIACNQACLDHIFEGKSASCLVNPLAGREAKWTFEKTSDSKKVAVIGGGPAGMEAARAHAEKGHQVTLFEGSSKLGGQLNLAKQIPGKQEFKETIRYYETELNRLGVAIKLNERPSPASMINGGFEKVIIAVGVKPRIPDIPGIEKAHVVTYADVLSGKTSVGPSVAIIGAGGIGCDLSHYLIDQGIKDITLMRRKGKVGAGLGRTTRWALISYLRNHHVRFLTGIQYKEVAEKGILIESRGQEKLIEADTIILASGQESAIWDEQLLLDRGIEVVRIGGAKRAGELDAKRAIYEGASLAFS